MRTAVMNIRKRNYARPQNNSLYSNAPRWLKQKSRKNTNLLNSWGSPEATDGSKTFLVLSGGEGGRVWHNEPYIEKYLMKWVNCLCLDTCNKETCYQFYYVSYTLLPEANVSGLPHYSATNHVPTWTSNIHNLRPRLIRNLRYAAINIRLQN